MRDAQTSGSLLKLTGFFFAYLFIVNNALGQTSGKVEVIKDPLIDSLIAKRAEVNSKGVSGSGYQVQIYLGSDRQEAYDAQNRFRALYPGVGTYISYNEPNYKVQVGDFRTRLEAQKLMNELKQYFPTLLVVPATINRSQ
jgi:hypothetical protein